MIDAGMLCGGMSWERAAEMIAERLLVLSPRRVKVEKVPCEHRGGAVEEGDQGEGEQDGECDGNGGGSKGPSQGRR